MKKFDVGKTSGLVLAAVFVLFLISAQSVMAVVNSVTPSTNDINRTNGWAHVDQLSQSVGSTELQFISTRNFYSCFEYRTDGDISQILSENGGVNYNSFVTDGLYPYYCQKNNTSTHTITANSYVEVRMVFGAETDERFDWTRFDVKQELGPVDVCANIDGVQTSVPSDLHLDGGGINCVSFSPSGPPEVPYTPPQPQVLGASTVLGATTMAKTGSFTENLFAAIMGIGGTLSTAGFILLKKATKLA